MAVQIAPLVKGLSEEGTGSHSPNVSNKLCNVRWKELQTQSGGPIVENNAVDKFLARGYKGRARIYMGRHSPQFALDAGQVLMTDAYDGVTAACVRWWEEDVQALQRDFMTKFAQKYDGKISAIYLGTGGTIYAEPFIRGLSSPDTRKNLLAAGYTAAKDANSYEVGFQMCKVFKSTRIAMAYNPWQYLDSSGTFKNDLSFTLKMMDRHRAIFPRRCLLQNNSIRTPMLKGAYPEMYAYMKHLHDTAGAKIGFQCATEPRVGSYQQTIEWAIAQGAHWVELSPGFYNHMTEAEMQKYDRALRAA